MKRKDSKSLLSNKPDIRRFFEEIQLVF